MFWSVKVCRVKLGIREAKKTCKGRGLGKLAGTVNDPQGGGAQPLPGSPGLVPLPYAKLVPEASAKSPLLFTVCRFAWGLNWDLPVLLTCSALRTVVLWPPGFSGQTYQGPLAPGLPLLPETSSMRQGTELGCLVFMRELVSSSPTSLAHTAQPPDFVSKIIVRFFSNQGSLSMTSEEIPTKSLIFSSQQRQHR